MLILSEKDNILLPYRYDIATDFNEYGFAMIGKNGKVSWIDKKFNYLNIEGKIEKEGNEFNDFLKSINLVMVRFLYLK